MKNRGFLDGEHREKFEQGRALVRRGGPLQAICGAKTRSGQLCRAAPLKGHWRCLRHAGPKAARELRQRQLRAVSNGSMSYGAFSKLEARRAANRMHRLWKRDPWAPGETTDLGTAETSFQEAVGLKLEGLPPAVADWLRWQYRRFKLDCEDDTRWFRTLHERLPARLARLDNASWPPRPDAPAIRAVVEWRDPVVDRANALRWEHPGWLDWLRRARLSPRNERAVLLAALEVTDNPQNPDAWGRWIALLREFGPF